MRRGDSPGLKRKTRPPDTQQLHQSHRTVEATRMPSADAGVLTVVPVSGLSLSTEKK